MYWEKGRYADKSSWATRTWLLLALYETKGKTLSWKRHNLLFIKQYLNSSAATRSAICCASSIPDTGKQIHEAAERDENVTEMNMSKLFDYHRLRIYIFHRAARIHLKRKECDSMENDKHKGRRDCEFVNECKTFGKCEKNTYVLWSMGKQVWLCRMEDEAICECM